MRGARSDASQRAADGYQAIYALYEEHVGLARELHASMLEEIPRKLPTMGDYDDEQVRLAREFVDDEVMMFRFLRRARFHLGGARTMLYKTLQWRFEGGIDDLPTELLHSEYISGTANGVPLFWLHSRFRDWLGRPCLYFRLQQVERAPDGLRDVKTTIIAMMDVVRQYLHHVNRRSPRADPVLQACIAVDVKESGISNFELELFPFLVDLLKHHYPGLFGSVYVLNYGWLQSGMWRMLKPVLPPKLLGRIFFLEGTELRDHFDAGLPRSLGGALSVPITPDSSDIFNYYARSAAWHKDVQQDGDEMAMVRTRSSDYGSIYEVMSRVGSVGRAAAQELHDWKRKQGRLRTTDSYFPPMDGEGRQSAAPSLMQWLRTWMQPREASPKAPPAMPRLHLPEASASSDPPSPRLAPEDTAQPAEAHNTVTRYLSRRAHKYAEMDGHVSPYNIENPYFGYPATYVDYDETNETLSPQTTHFPAEARSHAARSLRPLRRKRDLLRTLMYLFVLRIINAYRTGRHHIAVALWMLLHGSTPEGMSWTTWRSLRRTARGTRARLWALARMVRLRVVLVIGVLVALRARQLPMHWTPKQVRNAIAG